MKMKTIWLLLVMLLAISMNTHAQDLQDQSAANLPLDQDQAQTTPDTDPDQPRSIAPDDIEALIDNLSNGLPKILRTRVFSSGQLLEQFPVTATTVERTGATFAPKSRSLVVSGTMGGTPVLEDFRFLEADDRFVVIRDIYLSGEVADLSVGRATPAPLEDEDSELQIDRESVRGMEGLKSVKVTPAPQPQIGAIHGYTDVAAVGIDDGIVAMSKIPSGPGCGGDTYNGGRVVNDQPGTYFWEVSGSNFGNAKGTIQLGQTAVPAASLTEWTPTRIKFFPTVPYNSGPMCTVLTITTSAGLAVKMGVSIVPAIRTRIYGQCTWQVALARLNAGKQPSPVAYPVSPEPNQPPAPGKAPQGWTFITGDYIPQAWDQLEWNGLHTAIITTVSGPTSSGGITTWKVTVLEANADCKNGIKSSPSSFQVQVTNGKKSIIKNIQSSATNLRDPRSFYR